ncbi:MAG: hypothetical protein Fur0018_26980 [Anaerolineales bacterium]
MLTYSEFQEALRDLLPHLYDYVAVEAHPLARWFPPPEGGRLRLGEHIYRLIQNEVESLRPAGKNLVPGDAAWRPYLILKRRYLDGMPQAQLAEELAISERQLRRDQARTIEALARRLWQRFAPHPQAEPDFSPQPEWLALQDVLQGVMETLGPHVQATGRTLRLQLPSEPIQLYSDRIVLRQVLIRLARLALADDSPSLAVDLRDEQVALRVPLALADLHALDAARQWAERLSARLEVDENTATLWLPCNPQPILLVVDDQPPTVRMFQRYLGPSALQVMGIDEPQHALEMARRLQPALITLDVMMPGVDGWELLQSLQAAPETRHIPVIVCSAWDEPELAASLGAVDFLKKPVTRAEFLEALRRHGVPV